jgi:hypothetical protein
MEKNGVRVKKRKKIKKINAGTDIVTDTHAPRSANQQRRRGGNKVSYTGAHFLTVLCVLRVSKMCYKGITEMLQGYHRSVVFVV